MISNHENTIYIYHVKHIHFALTIFAYLFPMLIYKRLLGESYLYYLWSLFQGRNRRSEARPTCYAKQGSSAPNKSNKS